MKLLHTADLHLGKRLNEISLLEEQGHMLEELRRMARHTGADALIIAGDIYDKAVPPRPSGRSSSVWWAWSFSSRCCVRHSGPSRCWHPRRNSSRIGQLPQRRFAAQASGFDPCQRSSGYGKIISTRGPKPPPSFAIACGVPPPAA